MAEPTRTDHPPPHGPRIRYPILLGGLGVVAFLTLIIVIVIVVKATTPVPAPPETEDAIPVQPSSPSPAAPPAGTEPPQ